MVGCSARNVRREAYRSSLPSTVLFRHETDEEHTVTQPPPSHPLAVCTTFYPLFAPFSAPHPPSRPLNSSLPFLPLPLLLFLPPSHPSYLLPSPGRLPLPVFSVFRKRIRKRAWNRDVSSEHGGSMPQIFVKFQRRILTRSFLYSRRNIFYS